VVDDALPRQRTDATTPPRLRRGDRVALVSPAGRPPEEQLARGVALLESWGLVPVAASNLAGAHHRADYLAGSDADRAADLTAAWLDPEVAAVFCVRGGYGSMRILDLLDFGLLRTALPKLLLGSSDVTALHQAWHHELAVATLFSPMIATGDLLDDPVATARLHDALFGEPGVRALSTPATEVLSPGTVEGTLVGGNLSLLAASVGAPEFRPPVGAIGLLEDVTEEPYRLDNLLLQLRRAGWFEGLVGLALGSWVECGDPTEVTALLQEYADPLGVPVLSEVGFGHCAAAWSVPLGVRGRLVADPASPRLEVCLPL